MFKTIGIVGGMGSYATVDFFRRIIGAFSAKKEWERPRIVIDNFCTMPSRVRAILYNEHREELIEDLSSSVRNLLNVGAKRIIFACNTSHVFIPEVMLRVPECQGKIIHIIEACAEEISVKITNRVGGLSLIATEGTIETGIYDKVFGKFRMQINSPYRSQYDELRYFIEAVKQNIIDDETLKKFHDFVESFEHEGIILGCTEIPILYRECLKSNFTFSKEIYDPLQSAMNILVKDYSPR